ncbi:MAG: hypothetical protein NPIRA02_24160 [Nitrospirales bacterium]|nr:MAG: hypothetical protein NPIRA02_24160 [Nitrospirales bacterium]
MPNALAHFGIQGVLTRSVIPTADPKLIFLGCILPDVPWILQRVLLGLVPGIDPYSLRLYVIVQASLFMTMVLCAALASLSHTPGIIFGILASSAVVHLALDALQIKWANGVHFFAPVSWELFTVGWFWPESWPTYLLTSLGFGYVLWSWKSTITVQPFFLPWSLRRNSLCLGLFLVYMTLPLAFLDGPLLADNHFVKTLIATDARVGRPVEFDRKLYVKGSEGDALKGFGEVFKLRGKSLDHQATVSIRGRFVELDTIELVDIHAHDSWFRNGSSYIGLLALAGMWAIASWRYYHCANRDTSIQ